jgi:DNA-binding Lrp family transcriptional regulator
MSIRFILIKVESSQEHKAYDKLSKLSEIKNLLPVKGEYDLIAQVETDSFDKLSRETEDKIKSIAGVLRTKIVTEPKF